MSSNPITSDITALTREEAQSRRKMTITIGLILSFLAVSFYAVTIVRLKDNVAKSAALRASQSVPGAASAKKPKAATSSDSKRSQ